MDDLDRTLATALVHDGRLSFQELARTVHLSANSTAERVRRLRQTGVISGYHAELSLAGLGRTLDALSDIKLKDDIDRHLADVPQVLSATHTTGEYDYQLRLACTGTDDLETVVDDLRWLGAREIHSRIVLGEVRFDPTRLLRSPGLVRPEPARPAG
jgi:Lrp/AsnC family leucine-responsive transcriptional regulator